MDAFDLSRFVQVQEKTYERACTELRAGRKESHWIWFIFPQLDGLGHSPSSHYYGIKGLAEAKAYIAHPVLGERLRAVTKIILQLKTDDPRAVFGTDAIKLRSSMTLFHIASPEDTCFSLALKKFFGGATDGKTVKLLEGKT